MMGRESVIGWLGNLITFQEINTNTNDFTDSVTKRSSESVYKLLKLQ